MVNILSFFMHWLQISSICSQATKCMSKTSVKTHTHTERKKMPMMMIVREAVMRVEEWLMKIIVNKREAKQAKAKNLTQYASFSLGSRFACSLIPYRGRGVISRSS